MVMFYGTSWVGVALFSGFGLRMAAAVLMPELLIFRCLFCKVQMPVLFSSDASILMFL